MEQKLIDVLFGCLMVQHSNPNFHEMEREEVAEWARKQIKGSTGIETIEMGMSWGVIKK